jgi:outer membrane protein OmpA-like peptidoglycan-associated protein
MAERVGYDLPLIPMFQIISNKNQKALDAAGKFLEQNKFRLAVVATSSEVGDTKKDRVLTQARAKVVRDLLVQNFKLDDTKLKTIGLGKSSGTGETSEVEIRVYN